MNKIILLLTLLFITSCATSVQVESRNCKGEAVWRSPSKATSRVISKKVMGFGVKKVFLKDVFESENINCSSLETLSIELNRNWFDAFVSIFPGLSSQTLKIYY